MIEIRHKPTASGVQAGYNEIFQEKSIAQPRLAYRWMMDQLQPKPGSRLLDVACGEGTLLDIVIPRGVRGFGCDFSTAALRVAASTNANQQLSMSDGTRLPYADESFDYVTNIGSLEHYESMETGASEMARVLKSTGRAFILLPNTFGKYWNIYWIKQMGDIYDDGQPLQRYGTRRQWEQLLEAGGFTVERMIPFNWAWPKGWEEWRWYLQRPRLIIALLWLNPRCHPNLANTLIFVCSKRPS